MIKGIILIIDFVCSQAAVNRLYSFISTRVFETKVSGKMVANMCRGAAKVSVMCIFVWTCMLKKISSQACTLFFPSQVLQLWLLLFKSTSFIIVVMDLLFSFDLTGESTCYLEEVYSTMQWQNPDSVDGTWRGSTWRGIRWCHLIQPANLSRGKSLTIGWKLVIPSLWILSMCTPPF